MTSVSLECIAKAARWDLEFLQPAGRAADQAVLLQVGAETVNGSTAAVLPTSSSLFQLPCLFPRRHPG